MSVTIVQLEGTAAHKAQHLVAKLLAEGYQTTPGDDLDTQRSVEGVAAEIVVGLTVHATYDVVKHSVLAWARDLRLDKGEIDIEPGEDDSDA